MDFGHRGDDAPPLDETFPLPLDAPFTTQAANAAGLDRHLLVRLVRRGLLRRPLRGVYVPAQVPDSADVRAQALGLVVPAGSVVTDWTASWLHTGVDAPNSHLRQAPLSVFKVAGRDRLRNDLCASGERTLTPEEVTPLTGRLLVTTPLRTACDLGRLAPAVTAIGGMDALLGVGTFTREELVDEVRRFKGYRGVVQLRQLAPLVDARAESPGESALRLRWLQTAQLPPPELQIPVYTLDGVLLYRVDLGVPELRFGAEYDGERYHTEAQAEHDARRRRHLDHAFGWTVRVFRRQHVYGTHGDARISLSQGLAEARRRHSGRAG